MLQYVAVPDAFAGEPENLAGLKIGAVLAQTGPAAAWGRYARMGAALAVEESNARLSLKGAPPVTFIIEDGQTAPASGVSAFQKLVSQDKVQAVIGDVWAFITQPLIPLANRSKVLLGSPTVVPESIAQPGNWFFSLGAQSELSAPAIDQFFTLHSKLKRVAIFCWDDPWGESVRKIWKQEIEKHGMTIVREVCVSDFDYDFRTDVTKVAADQPEIILISYRADKIIRALRERKVNAAILSTEMIEENLSDGTLPWEHAQGVYAWYRRPAEDFRKLFKARYKEESNYLAQNSYDTVNTIISAWENLNGAELSDSFRKLHFDGAVGQIDFRQTPWGNRSLAQLNVVKGKALVPVQ